MLKNICAVILVNLLSVLSFAHSQQSLSGWHIQGQTFLIWEHSVPTPPHITYNIYTSSQPVTSISNATWIGRVFANNGANSRIHEYVADARWKLPDSSGGTVTVDTNEAYFVVTPHTPGTAYYAVVLFGDTIVGSGNATGPILETVDPVSCIIQYEDTIVTIYAHWIDGRADYDSGRLDYPVMGNEYSKGLGFNFAVWKQQESPPGKGPLNICLHGGTDNFFLRGSLPYVARYLMPNGFFVSFDDPITIKHPLWDSTWFFNTMWFGYNKKFCRFSLSFPTYADTIINYTMRRLWWTTSWLLDNFPIDSNRISLMGFSMGANGLGFLTQLFPELYSAALAFVPREAGSKHPGRYWLIGFESQNIPTNLDGNIGVYDAFSWTWRLQNLQQSGYDWPFTIIVSGKSDTLAEWEEKPGLYHQLDSARTGFALYWDGRTHENWSDTVHFRYSEHLSPSYLARFRNDQSFPAFSGTDLDIITPGRQPDPGNGDPIDGDPWGTWGGYLEWDTESIVDTSDRWAVTMWVVYQSIYPNDIPDADTILVNVTPRRLQQYQPQTGYTYSWSFVKVSSDDTLQQGTVVADSSGLITVPDLLLIKEPVRLTIRGAVGVSEGQYADSFILLYQSYPNPFRGETVIGYQLSVIGEVSLKIYNLAGQRVRTLVNSEQKAGNYTVKWAGRDDNKNYLSSGIYFIKLKVGAQFLQTKKMILLR